MGAYILRRLLLIIPTLLGIMIINFALIQLVPGGPIEQIISQMEGEGDVFQGIAGGGDFRLGCGGQILIQDRLFRGPCSWVRGRAWKLA